MPYEVWRQDDNGNRFLVASHRDRSDAERHIAELTRNPHKQFYWITERSDDRKSPPENAW